jgi:hypothetical protein
MAPGAETAIHRHGATDLSGNLRQSTLRAQSDWTKALDKLAADADADIDDLIGPGVDE